MKTAWLTFATLALVSSVAAADPVDGGSHEGLSFGKDGYVGLGAQLGEQRDVKLGAVVDGGLRLGDTPLYARARYAHGLSGSEDGRYHQGRVGLEARACTGIVCGFVGLDVGLQYDHVVKNNFCIKGDNGGGCDNMTVTTTKDFLAVPRVGLEVGKTVKFYLEAEMPNAYRLDMREPKSTGLSVTAGLRYSW